MRTLWLTVSALAAAATSAIALAGGPVGMCVDKDGKVEITDKGCGPGQQASTNTAGRKNEGDLYVWTDPSTDQPKRTTELPPYPIKKMTESGKTGDRHSVYRLEFDESSPEFVAARERRRAEEALAKKEAAEQRRKAEEQRQIAEQQQRRKAEEQRQIAEQQQRKLNEQALAEKIKADEKKRLEAEREASAVKRVATQSEIAQCVEYLKNSRQWRDRESLRVEGVSIAKVYQDKELIVTLEVNAKNRLGAYVGANPAICTRSPRGDISAWMPD